MAQWYYSKGGEQKGPVEQQELQRLCSNGEVKSSDLVWRDGMANWQPVSQVPELAAVASAQPQAGWQQPAAPQAGYQQPQAGYQQPGFQQPGYQQPPYGQPGQPPLGYGGYAPQGAGYAAGPSFAKDAQTAMILSIIGLVCCGICGIIGLVLGMKAKKNMQASGNFEGQGMATAAIVMGWISIAFMIIGVIAQVAMHASR
jgi:hypothetical protein